jgi:hypothetical protein
MLATAPPPDRPIPCRRPIGLPWSLTIPEPDFRVEVRGFEPLASSVRVSGSPPLCGEAFRSSTPTVRGEVRRSDIGPPGRKLVCSPGDADAGADGQPFSGGPWRQGVGGEDGASRRGAGPAGAVEVVAVVVVTDQHGVDRAEVGGGDRRAGQLPEAGAPAEAVPAARGVEGRIGQQPPPPTSIRAVGPPMWVMRVVVIRRRLVLAGGCPGARG